jgi:hypothetical protein
MAESQGSVNYGKDVGYVLRRPIPKAYVDVPLNNGGIQCVENQRMPSSMGTVWMGDYGGHVKPDKKSSSKPTPGNTKG